MILNEQKNIRWMNNFSTMLRKLLTNFPIVLDIDFQPDHCLVTNRTVSEPVSKEFYLDFSNPERTEIFKIREWIILNWCPKIIKVKEFKRAPTPEEISARIEKQRYDKTVDLYESVVQKEKEVFYIEKMNPRKRQVVLTTRDIEDDKQILKMNVPIYKFIKDYHSLLTVEEASEYFFKNSELEYIYYSKKKK